MSTLVIGGTGVTGSEIVKKLIARGEKTIVMTRSKEKMATLPAGAEGVVADLADPTSLSAAFRGVDYVMLITVVHPDESKHGEFGVKAAKKAGVKRIVYMSVVMPPGSTHIPHFASKIPIENAIKESGMAYTILRPNNFYQNEFWFKDAIVKYGIYPQPIGSVGLNRVDIRDIADAAVNSLLEAGHEGKVYNVNGPEALTGKDVARILTKHLGSEVNYAGDDLDAWAQAMSSYLPPWLLHDYRIMYEYFQAKGLPATAADHTELEKVLHHKPRTFDSFVAEIAPEWKK